MKLPNLREINFNALASDFRNLNPNDVGTWPLLPRITILIGLFILALVGGWWLLLDGELTSLENKQIEEKKLRDEFVAKKGQAINLELYKEQLAEINRNFGALLKQLPSKSEMESLLVEISQSGLGRGLQFELFKPGQETFKDFYAELPVAIRMTGGYNEFGAFAGDIGALSRIVTLGNVSIAADPKVKDGSLVLETTAKTFRYLDDEEIAKQKKAAADAKKETKKGAKK